MNILDEYILILQKISELKDDIDIKSSDLNICVSKVGALEKSLMEAIQRRDGDNSMRIYKAIDDLKAAIDNEYKFKVAGIQQKINLQQQGMSNEIISKMEYIKNHDKDLKEISELESKMQPYNSFVVSLDSKLKCPNETFEELKKRIEDLKLLDSIQERKIPLTDKILSVVSGKQVFDGIDNPKVAVGAMTLYVVILCALALAIPQVSLIGYSALTIQSAFSVYHNDSNLNTCIKAYTLCLLSLNRFKSLFTEELNKRMKQESKSIEDRYFKEISKLEDSISDIEAEREKEKLAKDELINDENFKAKTIEDLIRNVQLLENDLTEAQNDMIMSKKELNSFNSTNSELIAKKNEIQTKITEDYILNLTPGDSVTMVEKLFLGFNDDDSLITIDNPGTSNLILYSGDSSNLTELATLILIQLFKSFDISILSVKIVDTTSIGTSFQVFNAGELEFVTEVITTETDFESSICKGTYESLPIKNRKILSKADDIYSYNIAMKQKNSLPMGFEYHIIINGGKKIFDSRYVKLCKDGKISGVYPFVFLSLQDIRDELGRDKPDSDFLKGVNELIPAMEDWYNYVPAQNSFTKLGKVYRNNLINDIKKKLITLK